jgi:6-phosphogluconolactonase
VEAAINGPGNRDVRIFPDGQALSHAAADLFRALADTAVTERGRYTVALSGGSTPKELYTILGNKPYADRIDWDRVHLFWADERCVPPDHGDSNYRLAQELLISRVPIPGENVHRIRGEEGAEQAAAAYERDLKSHFGDVEFPAMDLVLLGAGEDGHTASLFPGSLQAMENNRLAAPVFLGTQKRDRVTLTLPVLNHARQVLFLASGQSKQRMIKSILQEGNPDRLPAGLVRPAAGICTWFLDEDAAASLSRGGNS